VPPKLYLFSREDFCDLNIGSCRFWTATSFRCTPSGYRPFFFFFHAGDRRTLGHPGPFLLRSLPSLSFLFSRASFFFFEGVFFFFSTSFTSFPCPQCLSSLPCGRFCGMASFFLRSREPPPTAVFTWSLHFPCYLSHSFKIPPLFCEMSLIPNRRSRCGSSVGWWFIFCVFRVRRAP